MKNTNIKLQKIFFNYEPHYENEVCLLFGLLLPYLKNEWIVDKYSGSFPDAIFFIDGKETRVEFEVFSADFLAHKHDEEKCDVIVCWKNNWPGCKLRVLELSKEMHNVDLSKIIKNNGTKYNQIINISFNDYYEHLERYNDNNIVGAIREFVNKIEKDSELILQFKKGNKVNVNINICIRKYRPDKTFIGLESTKNGFVAWPWFKLFKDQPVEIKLREIFNEKEKAWINIKSKNLNELKDLFRKIEKSIEVIKTFVEARH